MINTEAILGPGGCGKSTLLRERVADDPKYALCTASTGIAAVNLGDGVTTVHSALGFYDLRSLKEAYDRGWLKRKFLELAKRGIKNLVLDEISMFGADHLNYVVMAATEAAETVNDWRNDCKPVGLILSGDFCQLAPIPDDRKGEVKFAFESPYWEKFDGDNLTRLTKVHRQNDPKFLEALTLIRRGNGVDGALALKECGVNFVKFDSEEFDGITLFPTNAEVGNYNERRLEKLPGAVVQITSTRWGKARGEWKNIPDTLELKDGALVMVLTNDSPMFRYVNGDLGTFHVKDAGTFPGDVDYVVATKRGYRGEIPFIIRRNISYSDGDSMKAYFETSIDGKAIIAADHGSKRWYAMCMDYVEGKTMRGLPYWDPRAEGTVIGEVRYMPLRLAYGSSYHKCINPASLVCDEKRGMIEASAIQVGDRIATQGNVYATVTEVAQTQRPVCRVTTRNGYVLECSPEHRFPVNMQNLVEANSLVPGDMLGVSFQFLKTAVHPLNLDTAYLLGLLIGDGAIGDVKEGNVHFCSYNLALQNAFVKIVTDEFGIHVGRRRDGKGCFFTSKPLRQKLLDWGLGYWTACYKEVPQAILSGTEDMAAAFLRGVMDTDGSVSRLGVVYSTSSETLSRQVQLLFLGLGIYSVRSTYRGKQRDYYQIRIAGKSLQTFKSRVGFWRPDRARKLADMKPSRRVYYTDPCAIEPVKTVEVSDIVIPMVDFTVDCPNHVFYANGILTHNTQGLTLDNIQISISNYWAANPGMIYVALTRCRSAQGITIIGDVAQLSRRVKTARKVMPWV